MQAMEQTLTISPVEITWQDAFAGHLRPVKSESTVKAYLADVRAFALFFSEFNGGLEFDPSLLTSWDLREYRKHLIENHAAPATINRRIASLRALAAWCLQTGRLSVDPTADISGVGNQQLAPRWLNRADFGRLMRQAERAINAARTTAAKVQALRDRAILALMAYGSLRVSEVCGLTTADVTLSERRGLVKVLGKGEKYRTVPLAAEARRALSEYLAAAGIELEGDHRPLWQGKHGQGITPRSVQRMVEELGRLAGVEATPHRLRHTAAMRMIANVDVTVVAAVLGHSRIETTRRYTLPGLEELEAAVETI